MYIFIKNYLYIYKNFCCIIIIFLMPKNPLFLKCNGTFRRSKKIPNIEGRSQSESEITQILFQQSLMILFTCTDLIINTFLAYFGMRKLSDFQIYLLESIFCLLLKNNSEDIAGKKGYICLRSFIHNKTTFKYKALK